MVIVAGLLGFGDLSWGSDGARDDGCNPSFEWASEIYFENYRVRATREAEDGCYVLEIEKDGKSVYRETAIGSPMYFGSEWQKEVKPINRWKLKDGRQTHVLVMSQWTGGAHCCFVLKFFELGEEFTVLPSVETRIGYPIMKGFAKGSFPRIELIDSFLEGIFSSYAFTAEGVVVLRLVGKSFVPAVEYMRAPIEYPAPKTIAYWKKLLRAPREPDWPPPPVIQGLTDLVFRGHKETAKNVLDEVWPKDVRGKEDFWRTYNEALRHSAYYPAFQKQLAGHGRDF